MDSAIILKKEVPVEKALCFLVLSLNHFFHGHDSVSRTERCSVYTAVSYEYVNFLKNILKLSKVKNCYGSLTS